MIVTCDGCRTKYLLSDERVPERGIRVRCPKCKFVWRLMPLADESTFEVSSGVFAGQEPEVGEQQSSGWATLEKSLRSFAARKSDAIAVNGEAAGIPSMMVKPGDVVSVREKAKKQGRIAEALSLAEQSGFPSWVEVDPKKLEGKFKNLPERDEVAQDVNESLVVELYSR